MDTTPFEDFAVSANPVFEGVAFATSMTGVKERILLISPSGYYCLDTSNWNGFDARGFSEPLLYRSSFRIEPDLSSAFNAQVEYVKAGNIVRRAERAFLCGKLNEGGYDRSRTFDLINGLPKLDAGVEVGFSRWALVRDVEGKKQIFREFDTGRATGPDE